MHPGDCFLWSRCRQPNTPRDFAARLARRAGEPPSPGPAERERGDRELIATSPSRGAPFEGGSDAATRWNPTGKGFASVPEPSHGSVAWPVNGRANRDSGRARFAADSTTGGIVRHRPGPGRIVVPVGWLYGHRRCPRLRVG